MKLMRYGDQYKTPVALGLGFFDGVHLGHRRIIAETVQAAKSLKAEPAVLTFDNNPLEITGRGAKLIYTFSERAMLLKECGIETIFAASFDREFMATTAADFLKRLIKTYNVKAIVCGFDYTFGRAGAGNPETLESFAAEHGIVFKRVEEVALDGTKVSSTVIRGFLSSGGIASANRFLGSPYRITGKVTRGRSVGSKLLFPTANIIPPPEKLQILQGVYATNIYIDGRKYYGVTNAGNKPTFNERSYSIESYISGFAGNLYDMTLTVEFIEYLRDIKTFATPALLKKQIAEDVSRRMDME